MERCRLVFSGSGGQGVITAAILLAEAAVLEEGLNAVQTQVYKTATRGGATYDLCGVSMINAFANLVDSLYALKTLVYEQRRFTTREFLAAVDDDFVGHDAF